MIAPALLLAAALGIVGYGLWRGGGLSRRVAVLVGWATRRRMVLGWALGTFVAYGVSSLLGLLILQRLDAVVHLPPELRAVAWQVGLPAHATDAELLDLLGPLAVGAIVGLAIVWWWARRGKPPIGLRYRSPAAMRPGDGWMAATLLALSAGISEELFFRLLLPLLLLLVTGSGWLAILLPLLAFAALHRHQGWAGMVATGLIGAVLLFFYLATGRLWLAMLLHVLIDLNALVLRPWITRRVSS